VNLFTGNYSHYILLIKDSKTVEIFFYKGTRLDRKYFITKFYFWFYTRVNKTRSSLSRHATRLCLYRHSFSFESNYALVRKKKPQIGNCWVYIYRQRKKFSRIFHLYRISSLSGLARTLEIEYLVRHKITQSRTIPRTTDVFSRTICPQNPAQF